MKIAISLATGPVHKWGYQHVYRECLASQAEFAERVYLVQSTSDATGVQELLDRHGNVAFISNPVTWHHRPGTDDRVLSTAINMTEFHMRNLATGRLAAFRDGYRVVLSTHSNWYIPRQNVESLCAYCERFYRSGERTGKIWMMTQLADVLLGPGACGDFLCNLTDLDEDGVRVYYPRLKWNRPPVDDVPGDAARVCVVDCPYELTPEEFGSNQVRWPEYRTVHWDMDTYITARAARLLRLHRVQDAPLDYWGQQIAAKSRPDFMARRMLDAAGIGER